VDRRNIVLTGFMGTGKSTVGRLLAARLERRFVDTDSVIEERHGPIPRIFAEQGEEAFRQAEREVAAELARRSDLVVATGGRLMVDPENASVLGAASHVVCLGASVDEIVRRVSGGGAATRPLLADDDPRARITELLAERAPAYGRFTQVDTDGRTPDAIVDEIIELVTDQPPA
jgi:shikimate kinase